jgi:U3 small nucleolar ribonucleoprotein component
MALIAITDINYGRPGTDDGDAQFHYFEAGEEVDESVFCEEHLQELVLAGAVEESAVLEEVSDLRKQVEELQRQLAAMESEHAGKDNMVTNARAVDQTALDPLSGVEAGTIITQAKVDELGLKNVTPADQVDEAKGDSKAEARPESTPTAADKNATVKAQPSKTQANPAKG